jgi:hypothetical protein
MTSYHQFDIRFFFVNGLDKLAVVLEEGFAGDVHLVNSADRPGLHPIAKFWVVFKENIHP